MKLHYAGDFNGDESTLPKREHHPRAVAFKEPEDKMFATFTNIGGIISLIILSVPFILIGRKFFYNNKLALLLGAVSQFFTIYLHEFLHAICYKKDVYFYKDFSRGRAFVIGTEDMSKARFIFMIMFPNIILGIIPYVLFLIYPKYTFFGIFGLLGIIMGFGDYIGVYLAITQMPKGAKTYISGSRSYWYI